MHTLTHTHTLTRHADTPHPRTTPTYHTCSDVLSKILNEFASVIPDVIEDFIRLNAQTQGLSITDQVTKQPRVS